MQFFKLELKSKHHAGALADYNSLGKVPSNESPKSLCDSVLCVGLKPHSQSLLAKKKKGLRSVSAWLPTDTLADSYSALLIHLHLYNLDNQCVKHNFLHL